MELGVKLTKQLRFPVLIKKEDSKALRGFGGFVLQFTRTIRKLEMELRSPSPCCCLLFNWN